MVPVLPLWQRYLGYFIRLNEARFRYFFGRFLNRIPDSVFENVDLLVVNEIEYLHWDKFRNGLLKNQPTYLDLHEDHVNHADRDPLERFCIPKVLEMAAQSACELRRPASRKDSNFIC